MARWSRRESMSARNGKVASFTLVIAMMVPLASPSEFVAAQTTRDTLTHLAAYMPQSREAEVVLARTAAPASVSSGADVLVLDATGYEVASKGTNGFVCYIERSWAKEPGDPEFWNPRVRAPMCVNPAAARSVLPIYLEKTKWVLSGATEGQVADQIRESVKTGKFSPPETGAMAYMMSRQQYINDDGRAWRPHVMFFFPSSVVGGVWGADLDESPILSDTSPKLEHLTIFMLPVSRWSDGSLASVFPRVAPHHQH